jgi:hypothetical protein
LFACTPCPIDADASNVNAGIAREDRQFIIDIAIHGN